MALPHTRQRGMQLMVTLGLREPSKRLALGQVVTFAQGPLPSFALFNSFTVPRYLPEMAYRLPFSPAAPLGEACLYYPPRKYRVLEREINRMPDIAAARLGRIGAYCSWSFS
jgi:hypothetical protein